MKQVMNTRVQMATIISLLTHMGLLMCHPASWRRDYSPAAVYLPGPQFCPDTGRTVCAAVDYYPTERIYNLLTSTRSEVFNITSLFVDERKGDAEPNLPQVVVHPPHYHNMDNYYMMHPAPGGRFSPAGSEGGGVGGNRSRWVSEAGRNRHELPWTVDQNRWRRVPDSNQNHPPNTGSWRSTGDRTNNEETRDVRENRSFQANAHVLNLPRQKIPPDLKSDRNNPQSEIEHSFIQQQRLTDENDEYNPYWGNQQPKNDEGRRLYLNADDGSIQGSYHRQNVAPQVNIDGREAYRSHGEPPKRPLQQWHGQPSPQDYGYVRRFPNDEPKLQNTAKRGRRNMDVEGACAVRSTFVPPRAALNDQSEWKYIVNVPERDQRFSQVVRVDLCLREGQPCSSKLSLPFGFVSRCRQKYIKKKLLSLNPDGQGTAEDNFFIPSCCVCEIVRSNDSGAN